MKLTLDTASSDNVFGHYGDGQLKVNHKIYESGMIIFPDILYPNWQVTDVDLLQLQDIEKIIERSPDIALIGTGSRQKFPSTETRRELVAAGLNLEFMDTAAACRTYNLLVSEGRDVAPIADQKCERIIRYDVSKMKQCVKLIKQV